MEIQNQSFYIRLIYVINLLFWIYLLYYYNLFYTNNIVETIIIFIPIILFILAIISANCITSNVESFMFRTNLLTVGLLVTLPLLTWIADKFDGDKKTFFHISATAIILSMFTMIDIWVPENYLCMIKHFKSGIQTIAIMLLIYAIYKFFVDTDADALSHLNKI